jgi:hypothetical protein
MKRAEEYRKKAEEAETMAAATRDPGAKKAYLEIAQQWRQFGRTCRESGALRPPQLAVLIRFGVIRSMLFSGRQPRG